MIGHGFPGPRQHPRTYAALTAGTVLLTVGVVYPAGGWLPAAGVALFVWALARLDTVAEYEQGTRTIDPSEETP